MELCSHHHEEICHNSGYCPFCDAKEEIKDLLQEMEGLYFKIDQLKDEIKRLEEE